MCAALDLSGNATAVNLLPCPLPALQYCDRGSLADALAQRRLVGKDGRPHMVGVGVWHKAAGCWTKGLLHGGCKQFGRHAWTVMPRARVLPPHVADLTAFSSPTHHLPAQVAVLLCLLDVASGMSYLHSLGIVHGGGWTAGVVYDGRAAVPCAMPCHAMPLATTQCRAMLCCAMPRDATQCRAISLQLQLSLMLSHDDPTPFLRAQTSSPPTCC